MKMRLFGALLPAASALALASPVLAQGVSIAISCGAVGAELQFCSEGAEAWARETGNTVEIVSTPNSSTERLALYQQNLGAGVGNIDVLQVDVVWPGLLGDHLVDLKEYFDEQVTAGHFQQLIANNTVDGRLVAMPWFIDAGLLYYRADLLQKYGLEPPLTWADMVEAARTIQEGERAEGNDRFWGYVWQGRAYEGLTCNALEWISSFNGGTIVGEDGKITINNPRAIEAVDLAASWVGDISPDGVLNYDEEAARGVFQSGNAAFMRNWPYAWALSNSPDSPVNGKVGVLSLPKGGEDGKSTGVLGGWQLAVSKYSDNVEVAVDLVRYLTGFAEQKRRAIEGSFNPTLSALYDDPEILAANPFMGELKETFVNAIARPSGVTGGKYNEASSAFWNAVHATLSGNGDAASNLAALERDLIRLSRGGRW